jgi:hypothetical protein
LTVAIRRSVTKYSRINVNPKAKTWQDSIAVPENRLPTVSTRYCMPEVGSAGVKGSMAVMPEASILPRALEREADRRRSNSHHCSKLLS